MRIGFISGVWGLFTIIPCHAQQSDSIRRFSLPEITIVESSRLQQEKRNTLTIERADKDFLRKHFTGNFMQTMNKIPGVRSMDIGSGFSKPIIRGLGFNRIAVLENGIKQEGQQWGADHGLELDAFGIEIANVVKGPASLLYGSDAMGGVIDLAHPPTPIDNQLFGEVSLLGKSVNGTIGGSVLIGIKRNAWYSKLRFSEQRFGDYRIPADTVVYLTQQVPVYGRRLKNTAGFERDINFFTQFKRANYMADYQISNVHQKTGFFPGAHGIPDRTRVQDDGDPRNIEMPYSKVNHLKITTHQQYTWNNTLLTGDVGYQNNHREEWSAFHSHYGTQQPPKQYPNKELVFKLNTYHLSLKARFFNASLWQHTIGGDMQYQGNSIAGYSFLLPAYNRLTTGVFWMTTFQPFPTLSISGGIRYDYGHIRIAANEDTHLATYLHTRGYTSEEIDRYRWNSHAVNRHFDDFSCSFGMIWYPSPVHLLKMNIGRSFRLPGANELASNGIHHGTFRHEQGKASLSSEEGWQIDASYRLEKHPFNLSVSPFASWFSNYIFLRPTGEWSVLPHAGQIYRYTEVKAFFSGLEAAVDIQLPQKFGYQISADYVYTYNCDEHIALSFSPPATMRNTINWQHKALTVYAEWQAIAHQNRVDYNEDRTPGSNLFNLGGTWNIPFRNTQLEITFTIRNIFDTKYYNHLSFYRKVEIPEPGRNFQLFIKIPFKKLVK